MGIDVRIYIHGADVGNNEAACAAVGAELSSWSDGEAYTGLCDAPPTSLISWIEGQERYFDAWYPRGDWPRIRAAIEALQRFYPDHRLTYGSDHDGLGEYGRDITPELLAELDAAYAALPDDEDEDE